MKKDKLLETLRNCIPSTAPKATKKAMEKMCDKIADSLRNYYEMPCSLGDMATDISEHFDGTENPQMYSYIVESIAIERDGDEVLYIINNNWWYKEEDINKIVFFGKDSKERADKAVKKKEKPTISFDDISGLSTGILSAAEVLKGFGLGKFKFNEMGDIVYEAESPSIERW